MGRLEDNGLLSSAGRRIVGRVYRLLCPASERADKGESLGCKWSCANAKKAQEAPGVMGEVRAVQFNNYVSNGMFICAALAGAFQVYDLRPSSLNVAFNFSGRDLRELRHEARA
jgi:hypothetical protein